MKKVILLGNLTKDVEEVEIGKGKNIINAVSMSIACNSVDKDGNKYSTFVNMLYFGNYEKLMKYLKKGNKVLVEGELQSFEDDKGFTQLRVVPRRIELC